MRLFAGLPSGLPPSPLCGRTCRCAKSSSLATSAGLKLRTKVGLSWRRPPSNDVFPSHQPAALPNIESQ